jgi:hypothetical protein
MSVVSIVPLCEDSALLRLTEALTQVRESFLETRAIYVLTPGGRTEARWSALLRGLADQVDLAERVAETIALSAEGQRAKAKVACLLAADDKANTHARDIALSLCRDIVGPFAGPEAPR